jgi:hypothetical protein
MLSKKYEDLLCGAINAACSYNFLRTVLRESYVKMRNHITNGKQLSQTLYKICAGYFHCMQSP